jgi:deazaflavin-dependent oxidoreductase (nitroreductase family)
MRFQGAANRVVRVLLRTPGICRLLGRLLITVSVVGRKSGTRYVIPVAYTRHDGALLIGTPFGWARNLRTGTPVTIRLKGKQLQSDVEVIKDEVGVVAAYAIMAADNKNFASFNQIGFDADGRPKQEDLHLAWQAGARAYRLTPR